MKLFELKEAYLGNDEDTRMHLLEESLANTKETGPLEVADIVKNFPNRHKKFLSKIWGGPRLVYHGMPFFDEIYDKLDAVIEKAQKRVEIEIEIPLEEKLVDAISKDMGWDDFEYIAKVDDSQEVYMGYSPKEDCLYVGIDAWLDEEEFNEAWDKQFKRNMHQEFEYDEPSHSKLFSDAFKKYQKLGFQGVLFKLTLSGKNFKATEVMSNGNGFYQGTYKSGEFKSLGLVDLRLD
jgi:hypothetical protein